MKFTNKERYGIDDLLEIMEILRSPGGCPWDREQTHASIRKNFIEETYEACEAIDNGDTELLKEELGDVLLQVIFHTQIEKDAGAFDFGDVCDGICKKLIYRHPHIFSDVVADTADEVLSNWEQLKRKEKHQKTGTDAVGSVPKTLPALMRSQKVQARAAKSGFDYPDADWALKDLHSEVEELNEALRSGNASAVDEELGDLMFSCVNVARFLKIDAEESLTASCEKFIARYARVEQIARERGVEIAGSNMDMLNDLWQEAKIKEC